MVREVDGERSWAAGAWSWQVANDDQIVCDSVDSTSPELSLRRDRFANSAMLGWALAISVSNMIEEYNGERGLTDTPDALRLDGAIVELPHLNKQNPQSALRLARSAFTLAGAFQAYYQRAFRRPQPVFKLYGMEVGSWRAPLGCAVADRDLAREKIMATIPAVIGHFEPLARRLGNVDHLHNAGGMAEVGLRCEVWRGSEADFHQRVLGSTNRTQRPKRARKKAAAS